MIKLTDLINELEKPTQIYAPGYKPEEETDELIRKGAILSKPEVDPETGKITSTVKYLPKFKQMRIDLQQKRNEIKPFKFSSNPDIVKIATDADKMLGKLAQLVFALDNMIQLQQQMQQKGE